MLPAILILLSSSMFQPTMTRKEKLKILEPLFSPRPGELAVLDARILREKRRSKHPEHFQGYIKVTPPKNRCLIIGRGQTYEDIRVCRPKSLSFRLGDLSRSGVLKWSVSTGGDDFGTELEWKTPYRVAYATAYHGKKNSAPDYIFLKDCQARIDSNGRRSIKIGLMNGKIWQIGFPDRDKLLPQPPKNTNLWGRGTSSGKVNVKEAARSNALDRAMKGENKDNVDFVADRKAWHIPMKNSYGMTADNFRTDGDVPQGIKGKCRYRFSGSEEDLDVGRIECHDMAKYKFLLTPLTCMKSLGGPRT